MFNGSRFLDIRVLRFSACITHRKVTALLIVPVSAHQSILGWVGQLDIELNCADSVVTLIRKNLLIVKFSLAPLGQFLVSLAANIAQLAQTLNDKVQLSLRFPALQSTLDSSRWHAVYFCGSLPRNLR